MNYTVEKVTLNREQKLYVLHFEATCGECHRPVKGKGYITCYGFDVLHAENEAIARELKKENLLKYNKRGTLRAYRLNRALIRIALDQQKKTGKRLAAGLTPQLVGLEHKRVEVVDAYGERRRFIVGRSTGVIPCHLELSRVDSSGGGSVTGAPFKSVRVID